MSYANDLNTNINNNNDIELINTILNKIDNDVSCDIYYSPKHNNNNSVE